MRANPPTQRPPPDLRESGGEPAPAAPVAQDRVSALEKRIKELERSDTAARNWLDESVSRGTGVKVKANLQFPTWDEAAATFLNALRRFAEL